MSRPFFETLRELRAGKTLEDLSESLSELVTAVTTTGKAGELILKLKVRPPKKIGGSYVTVEDDVSVKTPKRDRGDTVFFPLADGSLSRQDPQQLGLNLRPVPAGVDPETGEVIKSAQ